MTFIHICITDKLFSDISSFLAWNITDGDLLDLDLVSGIWIALLCVGAVVSVRVVPLGWVQVEALHTQPPVVIQDVKEGMDSQSTGWDTSEKNANW